MKIPDLVDLFPTHDMVRFVYGEPYHTAGGATIITVARVRRRGKRRPEGDGDDFSGSVLRRPPWPNLQGWPPQGR